MEYLVAALACLLVLVYFLKTRRKNLPPGPWGVPILGYIPFLSSKPYLDLQRLAKKYGDIFSIQLGSHYTVILNDFESTKEAFARDEFVARPPEIGFQLTDVTKKTGAMLGPPWIEQRRLSLHLLRDLGFGKSKMEMFIQEEIEELLEQFQRKSGKPFSPQDLLASSMSNNITSLLFGKRLKYDNPLRQKLNKFVTDIAGGGGQVAWKIFFPWLKNLLEFLGVANDDANSSATKSRKYFMQEIEEHEKTLNPENIRDFIDGYLLEARKRQDPAFNKHVLLDLAGGFFGAGSETVRSSLDYLILLAAHNPKQQRRIQAEIDDVVGKIRLPTYPDQQKMPYTAAFLMEMQRWVTLVPVNLLRYTLADTQLGGYFIPKHTHIISNLYAVHHDAEYWGEDVEEFRPERFLTEDEKAIRKIDRYIPFSIGKRACPGEPLAKIEVFLYFTAILQRFDIRFPDGKEADFSSVLGITLRAAEQNVIMTTRNQ